MRLFTDKCLSPVTIQIKFIHEFANDLGDGLEQKKTSTSENNTNERRRTRNSERPVLCCLKFFFYTVRNLLDDRLCIKHFFVLGVQE